MMRGPSETNWRDILNIKDKVKYNYLFVIVNLWWLRVSGKSIRFSSFSFSTSIYIKYWYLVWNSTEDCEDDDDDDDNDNDNCDDFVYFRFLGK